MKPDNKYTQMQQKHYDAEASHWAVDNRDPVVGSFDKHNAWNDYDVYLFKGIDTTDKIALDFGCGPGRCIVNFANLFKQIDGVDISQTNLDNAEIWCTENKIPFKPLLSKVSGTDIAVISSNIYDVVYSTICLQHICVHEIRMSLMREFFRVLKPGGHICAQMGFGTGHPRGNYYYANNYDAEETNGGGDVIIDDAVQLEKDLLDIGFSNFEFDIRPVGPGDGHANWIFFRALKKHNGI